MPTDAPVLGGQEKPLDAAVLGYNCKAIFTAHLLAEDEEEGSQMLFNTWYYVISEINKSRNRKLFDWKNDTQIKFKDVVLEICDNKLVVKTKKENEVYNYIIHVIEKALGLEPA